MAYTRGTWPISAAGPKRVELCGSFADSAGSVVSWEGDLASVVSAGSGVYDLVLPGRGALDYLCITAQYQGPDTGGVDVIVTSFVEADRSIKLTVTDAGTPRDITTNERVHLRVTLHNTGLPKNVG